MLEQLCAPTFSLLVGDRRLGLGEILAEAATRLDALCALGGSTGSVIEVPARDPFDALCWMEGCWRAGRVPLPLERCPAPALANLPLTDAALVLRTSGSTGEPRCPEFTGAALKLSAERIARYLRLDRDDRVAVMQPLEHGFGLVGQLLSAGTAGACAVWAHAPFPDERAQILDASRATVVSAVPFVLARLLEVGLAPGAIRSVGTAGGPCSTRLAEQLAQAFPAALLWNQYGCTEAGPRLTACPSSDDAYRRNSVGKPIEGVTLTTDEDGELLFRTDTAMRGYLGNPAATERARVGERWRCGDVGHCDAEGRWFITGRRDDIVKLRGEKVSLRKVAEAVEARGARAALACLAAEDELCVLYEGDVEVRAAELRDALPLESLPSRLVRLARLPRLPSGKIDRKAAERMAREAS